MLRLLPLTVAFLLAASTRADTPSAPEHAVPVTIERVSFDQSPGSEVLVARLHTSGRVGAYSVDQEGGTLELVLYRTTVSPSVQRSQARMPVRSYRLDQVEDRVTVRFDVDPSVNVRAYPDRESADLLLSFSTAPRPRAMAWGGGVVRAPTGDAVGEPVAAPVAVPAPSGSENWRLDTIVLDAGHGGSDAGGVGVNGVTDRDVGFAVVQLLGPMIERELGVRVVYTRSDDTFVELRERGRIANRAGGKLFISVHGNAGPASAQGTETFFLAPAGLGERSRGDGARELGDPARERPQLLRRLHRGRRHHGLAGDERLPGGEPAPGEADRG